MGLKKLLTDLEYRTDSNIDFKSKSISHNDQFNNPPLIGRVSWDINNGNANPTFILGNDHRKGGLDGGGFRGGIATNIDRRKIDHERISNFLGDSMFQWPIDPSLDVGMDFSGVSLSNPLPNIDIDLDMGWQSPFKASTAGEQFKWRQIGLQRMNPRINAPMEGILEFSPANQRTYFPLATKTAVRYAGVSQLKREGTTLGLFGNGYQDDTDFLETSNKNRLIYLYNKNLKGEDKEESSGLAGFIENAGDLYSNVMNFIGGKGEMLYDYDGGPNSVFGIGRTFIGRYTNTNPKGITNLYTEDFEYSDIPSNVNFKNSRRAATRGRIREDAYGEIKYDPNLTKYIASDNHPTLGPETKIYNVLMNKRGIDRVNALNIFKTKDDSDWEQKISGDWAKDFIPFQFDIVDIDTPTQSTKIVFRAYIDSISDDYSANHNSVKYSGRAEKFYTYNEFDRRIAISFKIAALSRVEMEPIYRKLNYLVAQTAPNYKGTRMRTPYMKLTVGDWFNRLPGVLSNVSLNWSKDYPWEIALDKTTFTDDKKKKITEGQDRDMLQLPHVLDVSLSFLPIHKMRPENNTKNVQEIKDNDDIKTSMAPFINIDHWLTYGIADYTSDKLGTVEDFKKGVLNEDTVVGQPVLGSNPKNFEKIFWKNQREHIEKIQDFQNPNVSKEESFTQKWNKFKETLNNEGVIGTIKDVIKKKNTNL